MKTVGDTSYLDSNGLSGYPVFGDIYNKENTGFFAVETNQGFENNGSDPEGIKAGKYAVNNVESSPSGILSSVLMPGETMIKDITLVGDIPTNLALLNSYPTFKIWQDYVVPDPIINR